LGVIEEIWELDYTTFTLSIFKCKWIDINGGVRIDESRYTLVDLSKVAYRDEPFIMASQEKQVFYGTDPSNKRNKRWLVVLQTKNMHGSDGTLDIHEIPSFSTNVTISIEENEVDIVHATRSDHEEGIWED